MEGGLREIKDTSEIEDQGGYSDLIYIYSIYLISDYISIFVNFRQQSIYHLLDLKIVTYLLSSIVGNRA